MSREWKPGDVAMVVCSDGHERSAQYREGLAYEPSWLFPDGSMRRVDASRARPLVVIDPNDAPTNPRRFLEDIARKWHQAPRDFMLYGGTDLLYWLASQFEQPAPPKPPEPQGLGAVVEDAEGRSWLRTSRGAGCVWRCADVKRWSAADYRELGAVRVLSEGVTA